ncbi:hypothetical protein L226DRAFT_533290 [Lentinus tigrinus ALCF2SS1-7]|uniref:uncharacterized protein n=1 Tax=Lentinus tigrinus ALCF2SS1-7 TaxID=1328758 RepID=UPI001165E047|nr:hypothetical protein L226DRAFT_533290 [Lentinus tigrinus ALCF2SS1-7]
MFGGQGPAYRMLKNSLQPVVYQSRMGHVGHPGQHATLIARNIAPSLVDSLRHYFIRSSTSMKTIRTLDPMKLTAEDYLPAISLFGHMQRLPPEAPLFGENHLKGFLYYHLPSRGPPLAGELRFRVTLSGNPASFPSGFDLVNKHGVIWRVPLVNIASYEKYAPIRHLLINVDRTVPQQLMDSFREQGYVHEARIMHAFGQPFDLHLDSPFHYFTFVAKDRMEGVQLGYVTSFTKFDHTKRPQRHVPFEGTVMCCFEPSSLPEHAGRRVAVIRVLRSLESDPVRRNPLYLGPAYPQELTPRAGELLMTMRFGRLQTWIVDVDKKTPRRTTGRHVALRILFDNAVEYARKDITTEVMEVHA